LKTTALVLFGKVPLPGRVKTRLASTIGTASAAALSEAFLRDASRGLLEISRGFPEGEVSTVLAADPVPHPFWVEVFAPPWRIEAQGEGDLGRRLDAAFGREFERHEKVAVLGADHPALPGGMLRRFLQSSDAIWPTRDGGYAGLLLSRRSSVAALFEGMEWSTPTVCRETIERARRASIDLEVFPETEDVDRDEDLGRLAADLAGRDRGDRDFPRFTWEALHRLPSGIRL
jgi:rSAM/selenodomain-associated transferase 1